VSRGLIERSCSDFALGYQSAFTPGDPSMALRVIALLIGASAVFSACSAGTPAADTAPEAAQAAAPPAPASTALTDGESPAPEAPPANQPVVAPPPPPGDPLAVGTRDARDDMYCSALIYYENPDVSDALAPVDEALLRKAQMLGFLIGEAGINKLVEEKAAHATHARMISEAYAAQVAKDMKAKSPRLSVDACTKRAAALPIPQ
jgi:hypothetical protein